MATELNFDFSQIDPNFGGTGFLPVSDEKGWLVVLTGDNGFKQTNNGEGYYLELVGVGQEGQVAGQEFVIRLNLQHTKVAAMQAAQAQLAALGHVCGLPGRVGNTSELFNKPFRVVSEKQKNSDYTQLANNGIRDIHGNKPGKGGSQPQVAQPAPVAPQAPAQQAQQPAFQPQQQAPAFQPQQPAQQDQQQAAQAGGWQTGPAFGAQAQAPQQQAPAFAAAGQNAAPFQPQAQQAPAMGAPAGQPAWTQTVGR